MQQRLIQQRGPAVSSPTVVNLTHFLGSVGVGRARRSRAVVVTATAAGRPPATTPLGYSYDQAPDRKSFDIPFRQSEEYVARLHQAQHAGGSSYNWLDHYYPVGFVK